MDPIEAAVVRALEATGVPFELMACDPDFADTAAFMDRYGVSAEESVNTIVVVGKVEPRRHVACLATAATRLDVNGAIRRRMGVKKASFAGADETRELTGMMIGGVTPFGLPEGWAIWVDARVRSLASIVLGGGSRALKIRTSPAALERLPGCEFVDDLATPIRPPDQPPPG